MSEKEKKIMETIAKVIKGASAPTKDYLLGWAEGAASVVCGPLLPEQAAAERAPPGGPAPGWGGGNFARAKDMAR